jgi:hypothetical protein
VAVVRIQWFSFGLRGEATGQSIARRCSGGSEFVLAQWEGSVTRHSSVMTSTGGDATSGRGNGGNDVSWADANLTGPKNEENSRGRFSWY